MSDQPVSIWKSTMQSGAVIAMLMIIFLLITYIGGLTTNKALSYVSYLILFGGMYWGMKTYRTQSGGYVSYGKSFQSGVLVSLFAGIIISFATYILYMLDPGLSETVMQEAENTLLENGISEDMVEMQMDMVRKMMTPMMMFWMGLLGYILLGLVFSVIAAIFVKKEADPFS